MANIQEQDARPLADLLDDLQTAAAAARYNWRDTGAYKDLCNARAAIRRHVESITGRAAVPPIVAVRCFHCDTELTCALCAPPEPGDGPELALREAYDVIRELAPGWSGSSIGTVLRAFLPEAGAASGVAVPAPGVIPASPARGTAAVATPPDALRAAFDAGARWGFQMWAFPMTGAQIEAEAARRYPAGAPAPDTSDALQEAREALQYLESARDIVSALNTDEPLSIAVRMAAVNVSHIVGLLDPAYSGEATAGAPAAVRPADTREPDGWVIRRSGGVTSRIKSQQRALDDLSNYDADSMPELVPVYYGTPAAVRPADTREPDGWMNVEQAERLQTDRAITGTVHRVPPTGEQYVSVYFGTPAVQPGQPDAPPEYDSTFGDDRVCACGHVYYRHFDTYENMRPVGCKYCPCARWVAAGAAATDSITDEASAEATDDVGAAAVRPAAWEAKYRELLKALLETVDDCTANGSPDNEPLLTRALNNLHAHVLGTRAVQPDAPLPDAVLVRERIARLLVDIIQGTEPDENPEGTLNVARGTAEQIMEWCGLLPDGAQPPRIEFTKEWCAEKATQEAGHEVGAGAVCSGGGDGTQRRWAVTEVDRRWEEGVPHDPRSEALYKAIARIDMAHNADRFGWKAGGDGDNGEELMYVLDIYYAELDAVAALERVQAAAPAQPSAQQEEEAPQ